jgi:TfoX/Sxy family transcriptional regulator of competence genes
MSREQYYAMPRQDRILMVSYYQGAALLTGLHRQYKELERQSKAKPRG